jgi:hypothetical protein
MLTRRAAAVLTLALCLAGCANGAAEPGAAPASAPAAGSPSTSAPVSGSASASASPSPSTEPSGNNPTASGAQTITGTVEAGVEPNCRLIKDSAGSHLLFFDDASLRAEAPVGKKVTVTGRSEPKMMSTCQQGIPFVVSAVSPA